MDNNIHLGSKIRKYRHLAGMTQEELAEYSNLSVNYISKIEREKKQNVSIEKLVDICNALNISVEEIYLTANITFQSRTFRQTRLS